MEKLGIREALAVDSDFTHRFIARPGPEAQLTGLQRTPDQEGRYEAGMLPDKQAFEGLADIAFAAAGDRPRYVRDGVVRLQRDGDVWRPVPLLALSVEGTGVL